MKLLLGDCLEQMKTLEDNSVDAVVTDPPYGLAFMGKKWDYDVPSVDIWREVYRVLKPGGHVLSFGGTRTYHRMVVNIEDAGFEIRDQVMWIYGSGFPKSHNVSKAIDKMAGGARVRSISMKISCAETQPITMMEYLTQDLKMAWLVTLEQDPQHPKPKLGTAGDQRSSPQTSQSVSHESL